MTDYRREAEHWDEFVVELEKQSDDWYTMTAPVVDESYHVSHIAHSRPAEDSAFSIIRKDDLLDALATLNYRERAVMFSRYGV